MELVELIERLSDGARGLASGHFVVGGLLKVAASAGNVAPLQTADASLDPGLGSVGGGRHPIRIVQKSLFGIDPESLVEQRFGMSSTGVRQNGIRAQAGAGDKHQKQSKHARHNGLPTYERNPLKSHVRMEAHSPRISQPRKSGSTAPQLINGLSKG